MARLHEEDLRLKLIFDADAARKTLLDAKTSLQNLEEKLAKAKENLAQIDKQLEPEKYSRVEKSVQGIAAAYEKQRQKTESLIRQQKNETMTLNELQRHIKLTTLALKDAVPGTKNWEILNKELHDAKNRFNELTKEVNNVKRVFDDLPSWHVVMAGLRRGFGFISSRTEKARQAWLDYDEAMTDAIKTTNLSRGGDGGSGGRTEENGHPDAHQRPARPGAGCRQARRLREGESPGICPGGG